MSKTQKTAGEKPRIGEQEVRRAAELLKKYRQGKVNLERACTGQPVKGVAFP